MSYEDWALTVGTRRHPFGEVEVTSWTIGGREYRTDDTDRPRTDGRYFGQDFANPGDVEISVIIRAQGGDRQERFEKAMAIRDKFTEVWNADSIRLTPGATAELEIAGKAIVEGRPRHIDWDDSVATFGIIRGTALFVRNFDTGYSPGAGWRNITIDLVPPAVGGLKAPLVAPLTTTRGSDRGRPFTVGGDGAVWPIITVYGPISSGAQVELVNGWTVKLNRSLAYDQRATLDTRPGKRTMKLNNRAVNLLDPTGARLSQLSIKPGNQEIALRGTSLEGTARVKVEWREIKKVI